MRTILSLILSFVFTIYADAQNAVITGQIINSKADKVTFSYLYYPDDWLDSRNMELSAETDENGRFSIELPLRGPYTMIYMECGKESTEFFTCPGSRFNINIDANHFDSSISYSGTDSVASVNRFMNSYLLTYGSSAHFYDTLRDVVVLEKPTDYPAAVDAFIQGRVNYIRQHAKALPASFVDYLIASYTYSKYDFSLSYYYFHEIKKNKSYDLSNIPEENYEVVKTVPADFNDKYISILSYRNYVTDYYSSQMSAGAIEIKDTTLSSTEKEHKLADEHMPPATLEYIYAYDITTKISYRKYSQSKTEYEKYTAKFGHGLHANYLQSILYLKGMLSVGQPAIDFIITDIDGKKINLSDLKGKVVYITFWASWCGGCKMEMPHANRVQEHFKGKDVVFVNVSIDMNKAAWQKALTKYNLQGYNMRIDGDDNELAKAYGVRGVPYFFILDKEGRFASETTPRLSSEEKLIKLIKGLL